jgi:hypothetical protein
MVIMRTLSISICSVLLISASVKTVLAQERIRIATAGGLSIVPVWVIQDNGVLMKREKCANRLKPSGDSSDALGRVEAIVT